MSSFLSLHATARVLVRYLAGCCARQSLRRRSTALILTLPLALAGCGVFASGGAQEPHTPKGFKRATEMHISVAYPEDWIRPERARNDGKWTYLAVKTEGDKRVGGIAVSTDFPETSDPVAAGMAALAKGRIKIRGFNILGDRAIEVPGADGARRFSYTYPTQGPQGMGNERVRGVDVAIIGGQSNVSVVRINSVGGAVDKGIRNKIVRSVVLRGA